MHEQILNMMLANTCHNEVVKGVDGLKRFTFDLHCIEMSIVAECLTPAPWTEETVPKYKIHSYSTKAI